MRIYTVIANDQANYDCYQGFVVVARSKVVALRLAREEAHNRSEYLSWPADDSRITATPLGTTSAAQSEERVVLSDFNAG